MSELPDNPAGHICLSFDFDGPSLWIQRRSTSPTPVSRGEFGAVAVPRILKLLGGRNIPCTFFIPGHTIETYPDVCRMVADAGCEIGLHGYAHEFNPGLEEDDERWALVKSIELIEGLTGSAPVGYRAPSGDLTDQTVELLLEHDIMYDSSLMGHDYAPYRVRTGDSFPDDQPAQWGAETNLIELPFSWTLDDYVYLEFVTFRRMLMPGLKRPDDMFANFSDDIRWMVRDVDQGVCNVVFHPQVIGRGHRLMALERWLDTMAELGVNYARMDHVAHAVRAGRQFGVE
ncbi:MAG: polysaccharide deacetylase [Actinomycetia bacterium]|nr:polysaccharide deacetylase [Actinomycetes bacterium]